MRTIQLTGKPDAWTHNANRETQVEFPAYFRLTERYYDGKQAHEVAHCCYVRKGQASFVQEKIARGYTLAVTSSRFAPMPLDFSELTDNALAFVLVVTDVHSV